MTKKHIKTSNAFPLVEKDVKNVFNDLNSKVIELEAKIPGKWSLIQKSQYDTNEHSLEKKKMLTKR